MLNGKGDETVNITCTEQLIPEFPNLLFGTSSDGIEFFDATYYIQKQEPQKRVSDFFADYRKQIEALCESYDIPMQSVLISNVNGHYLIDGNFVYLFIAFVEPTFLEYMCDRIHELFAKGVSVSDTYLLNAARERLSKEVLEGAIRYEQTK